MKEIENMRNENPSSNNIVIRMAGDSGSGKSSLLSRFIEGLYTEDYISTIGTHFQVKEIPLDNEIVKVQIYDTAYPDDFTVQEDKSVRMANAHLIIYDVSNIDSFRNIQQHYRDIDRYASGKDIKLIVGTKSDSNKRVVHFEDGESLAKKLGSEFLEVSSKTGENVEEIFITLIKKYRDSLHANISHTQEMFGKEEQKMFFHKAYFDIITSIVEQSRSRGVIISVRSVDEDIKRVSLLSGNNEANWKDNLSQRHFEKAIEKYESMEVRAIVRTAIAVAKTL